MSVALLDQLIDALCCMPGIGKKSAQRISYHLLQRDRDGATQMASTLALAMENIQHCASCRTFSEHTSCAICAHQGRDRSLLCVVENPPDVYAIEASNYRGLYFVLLGHLSPLDNIGPEELGLAQLEQRLQQGEIKEVILATNTTPEGETTAHFIGKMAQKYGLRASRIAHGVPMGGELEYVNTSTLSHAINGRIEMS